MRHLVRAKWGTLVVGALYAFVTLPAFFTYPDVWPDEVLFASPAVALASGEAMRTSVLAGFIPGMDRYTFWVTPGYFLFLAVPFRFVDPVHRLLVMRLSSWLLGILVLFLVKLIFQRLRTAPWATWLGLAWLGTQASFARVANIGRMEMLTQAFVVGAVLAYLRFREKGGSGSLITAGLLSGFAGLSHPVGILASLVIASHFMLTIGFRALGRKAMYLFLLATLSPLLPWFVYVLQAPDLFRTQFGGQLARKASFSAIPDRPLARLRWAAQPLKAAAWGTEASPARGLTWSSCAALGVVGLGSIFLKVNRKSEGLLLTIWLAGGYLLNLRTNEIWYPVYFITPLIILFVWATVGRARHGRERALVLSLLFLSTAWNLSQAGGRVSGIDGGWTRYREYTAAIATQIPEGSAVLLGAVPDPYFGFLAEKRSYRIFEFVPEGVPVDSMLAMKTLSTIDYVVDTNCCNPAYLREYLTANAIIHARVEATEARLPSVVIWKLRKP